jgi:hypothetical protein
MDRLKSAFRGKGRTNSGIAANSEVGNESVESSTAQTDVGFKYGLGDPVFEDEEPTVE